MSSLRALRKLAGFEALEDTSLPLVLQGWATQLNRWLELIREVAAGRCRRLHDSGGRLLARRLCLRSDADAS